MNDLFLSRSPGFVLLSEAVAAGVHPAVSQIVLENGVLLRRGSVLVARIGAEISFFSTDPTGCDPDYVAATWYSLLSEAWIGQAH